MGHVGLDVHGGLRARDWDGKFYNGITGSYQGKFVRPTILSWIACFEKQKLYDAQTGWHGDVSYDLISNILIS